MTCPRYASLFAMTVNEPVGSLQVARPAPPTSLPLIGYLSHEAYHEKFPLFGSHKEKVYYYETENHLRIPICIPEDRYMWTGDLIEIQSRDGAWRITLY